MRRLEATGFYTISGRGLVFSMKEPDPPLHLGEEIEIALPLKGTIIGLERHPVADMPRIGMSVGVQMRFEDEDPLPPAPAPIPSPSPLPHVSASGIIGRKHG